jgi:hypothetical protein
MHDLVDSSNEAIGVMMKVDAGIENQRVSESERPQFFRQVVDARHHSAIEQDRNHRDPALQRCRDLNADKVRRIVNPPFAIAIPHPGRPYDRDDHERFLQGDLDFVPEIDPERNGIEIHENIPPPKFGLEPVEQSTGHRARVFAAIGDRDHRKPLI